MEKKVKKINFFVEDAFYDQADTRLHFFIKILISLNYESEYYYNLLFMIVKSFKIH